MTTLLNLERTIAAKSSLATNETLRIIIGISFKFKMQKQIS